MKHFTRQELRQKNEQELVEIALKLGVKPAQGTDIHEVVQAILEAQEQEATTAMESDASQFTGGDASGFTSHNAADPADEASGFVTTLDEASDASGFVTTREPASDASGFITSNPALQEGPRKSSRIHQLGAGDALTLNGTDYRITEIISESSGEAVIYKALTPTDEVRVIKLYKEIRQSERQEPNAEALSRIKGFENPDVLKLFDFGTGDSKYQGKYCFEVSEFAAGGTLLDVQSLAQKYTPEFLEEKVIPEIFNGICALHQRRIFHCDIKPQNIFYLDEARQDLVIGDYGSAKTREEEDTHEAKQFSEVIGTRAYLAPEQHRGIIAEANDYYSFGMVLLHLFYPEHFAKDDNFRMWDRMKLRKIDEAQFEQKEVIPFRPEYDRINQLIGGLTMYNHKARWGEKEVARWLKGDYIAVSYHAKATVQPIELGYHRVVSTADLIQLFQSHPDRWYKDLVDDKQGFELLLIWYLSRTDLRSKQRLEAMVDSYRPLGAPFVKEAIMRYFVPERPVKMANGEYDLFQAENVSEMGLEILKRLDRRWRHFDREEQAFGLFQLEFSLRQLKAEMPERREAAHSLLKRISQGLGIEYKDDFSGFVTQWPFALDADTGEATRQLLRLWHQLIPDRGARDMDYQRIDTIEEMGLRFARDKSFFDNVLMRREALLLFAKTDRKDLYMHIDQYEELLFRLFEPEIKAEIRLETATVSPSREYDLVYTHHRSLKEFFQRQGIGGEWETGKAKEARYRAQRKVWEFSPQIFSRFLAHVQQTHQIDPRLLTRKNLNQARLRFYTKTLPRELIYGLGEFWLAFVLLFPVLAGGLLLFLRSSRGGSLAEMWWQESALAVYAFDPKGNSESLYALYLLWGLVATWYLLALVPKLWLRDKLALVGPVKDGSPPLFHIRGATGFLALFATLLAPFLLSIANWMGAILGGLLLLLTGQLLRRSARQSSYNNQKRLYLAYSLFGLGAIWIGYQIYAWNNPVSGSLPGRGWLDIAWYGLALILLFAVPIAYQYIKPQVSTGKFIKLALLVLLAGLILARADRAPDWANINGEQWYLGFSHPDLMPDAPDEPATLVPDMWIARISKDFSTINVREATSNESRVLMEMPAGREFVVRREGAIGWWQVFLPDGRRGYMYSTRIEPLRQATWADMAQVGVSAN